MGRLFGTDGVRGVANADLTPELAFAIGRAGAAVVAGDADASAPIVVGRDTRLSGTMLEAAIVAGITSTGRDALLLGVVPTPAVAAVTRQIEGAAGVMISASHNPIEDNGIKFFGSDGYKLSDALEARIEERLDAPDVARPTHEGVGIARLARGLADRYAIMLLEAGSDLSGMTVVVDAAYGAAYAIAPAVFARLGARVVAINAQDDGSRINVGCGATDLTMLRDHVRAERATGAERVVGVAFDGDADRAKFVDEAGDAVDGDRTLLVLARESKRNGRLASDAIVTTVMSNAGFERALAGSGIRLERAAVGDRYVLEAMRAGGYRLGGEQSGHVIDLERNTTGDGPMTAVALLGIVARSGSTLHELVADVVDFPQVLLNVPVKDRRVADAPALRDAVAAAEAELAGRGRVLVRPSGTEPLVRVMVEAEDAGEMERVANRLAEVVAALAGGGGKA